jgi:hypothetical protein
VPGVIGVVRPVLVVPFIFFGHHPVSIMGVLVLFMMLVVLMVSMVIVIVMVCHGNIRSKPLKLYPVNLLCK